MICDLRFATGARRHLGRLLSFASRPLIQIVISCVSVLALTGCVAPPHAWQVTPENRAQIEGAEQWALLGTNDYVRVPDTMRESAVALLQDHSSLPLEASQLAAFAPGLAARAEAHPYLIRGVSFSTRPDFTVVRFDAPTGRLLIQQATYDGEILMPGRWVAEPNALVVLLPSAPEHVYPQPLLGGDRLFRGRHDRDSR